MRGIRREPGEERRARRRGASGIRVGALHVSAVRRGREHHVVRAHDGAEAAVVPRPRRSSRSSRCRATAARSRASGRCRRPQVGDDDARERRAAVGRAQRDHRARERLLAAVVACDDDERAVGPHDRLRADEDRARAHRRRPRDAAVGRELADGDALLVVRVLEVAAALERARGAVVARDPLLVEHHAAGGVDRRRPALAVGRARRCRCARRRARSSAC